MRAVGRRGKARWNAWVPDIRSSRSRVRSWPFLPAFSCTPTCMGEFEWYQRVSLHPDSGRRTESHQERANSLRRKGPRKGQSLLNSAHNPEVTGSKPVPLRTEKPWETRTFLHFRSSCRGAGSKMSVKCQSARPLSGLVRPVEESGHGIRRPSLRNTSDSKR